MKETAPKTTPNSVCARCRCLSHGKNFCGDCGWQKRPRIQLSSKNKNHRCKLNTTWGTTLASSIESRAMWREQGAKALEEDSITLTPSREAQSGEHSEPIPNKTWSGVTLTVRRQATGLCESSLEQATNSVKLFVRIMQSLPNNVFLSLFQGLKVDQSTIQGRVVETRHEESHSTVFVHELMFHIPSVSCSCGSQCESAHKHIANAFDVQSAVRRMYLLAYVFMTKHVNQHKHSKLAQAQKRQTRFRKRSL